MALSARAQQALRRHGRQLLPGLSRGLPHGARMPARALASATIVPQTWKAKSSVAAVSSVDAMRPAFRPASGSAYGSQSAFLNRTAGRTVMRLMAADPQARIRLSGLPAPALEHARRLLSTDTRATPDKPADAAVGAAGSKKQESETAAAKSSAAESSAAESASGEASRVGRPAVPSMLAEAGFNMGRMWSRGKAALKTLPTQIVTVVYDYIIHYPGETLYWAIMDRPRFKERMTYIWDVIKHEAQHYYLGFKLLGADFGTAFGLVKRVLSGKTLTRRERRQLLRTTSDLFRLVPFSILIIIPGSEPLLPFILRMFPGLLPSTFQTQDVKAAEQKKLLQMRVELASFLQDTMEYMGQELRTRDSTASASSASAGTNEAGRLMGMVTSARSGKVLATEDIVQVSKLFKDEITLENLGRHQLMGMARLLGLSAYGSDGFLRYQLRSKIKNIRTDDAEIRREGLEALSKDELIEACRDRGMRASGLTEGGLRDQLEQWLDLSMRKEVPLSLLILSRALTFSNAIPGDATSSSGDAGKTASSSKAATAKSTSTVKSTSGGASKKKDSAGGDVTASPDDAAAREAMAAAMVEKAIGGTPSTSAERALQTSIASLGPAIVEEALMDVVQRSGDSDELTVRRMRLRSVERENALIELERQAKDAAALAHTLALAAESKAELVRASLQAGDETELSTTMLEASQAAQAAVLAGQNAREHYAQLRREVGGDVADSAQARRQERRRRQREKELREAGDIEGADALAAAAVDGDVAAAGGESGKMKEEDDALMRVLRGEGSLQELIEAATKLKQEADGAIRAVDEASDSGTGPSAVGEDLELDRQEAEALLAMASASALQHEKELVAKIKAARLRIDASEMLAAGRISEAAALDAVEAAMEGTGQAAPDGADAPEMSSEDAATRLARDVASKRVKAAVDVLLTRLEEDLEAADRSIGDRLVVLDRDCDGIVSAEEMQRAIQDVLGNRNTEEAAAAIVARLDADGDGAITVEEVKRYAQLRADAEAEADWMAPGEVRKAVDQAREDIEEEEASHANKNGAVSASDEDDHFHTTDKAFRAPGEERS